MPPRPIAWPPLVWGSPSPNLTEGTEHVWLTTSKPELIASDHPGTLSIGTKAQYVVSDDALKAKQQKDALSTEDGAK
jgi:hypothetical protein